MLGEIMMEESNELRRGVVIGSRDAVKTEIAHRLRRSMTRAETMLWHRVRANRLNGLAFRRQQVISGFIVDFYCHSAGVAVEIDGAVHDIHQEYDEECTRIMARRGIRVIRFRNSDVETDVEAVRKAIADTCGECRGSGQPEE